MTISDKQFNELTKSVNDLALSMVAIKTTLDLWKWLVGGFAGAAFLIGLGALGWCWHLGNTVTAMEQQLADGGNTKLVAELNSPRSKEQLQANLATVAAQIQTARVYGKKPDEKKISALSSAISQVVKGNPDLPIAWQAAVQLVDYRFQPEAQSASFLPNCLQLSSWGLGTETDTHNPDGSVTVVPGIKGHPTHMGAAVSASNCQLDLDDDGTFNSTAAAHSFDHIKLLSPDVSFRVLILNNAYIKYSGGKMLPVNEIRFTNCSFEIKPSVGTPDKRGQSITTQLLTADTFKGDIQLPYGI